MSQSWFISTVLLTTVGVYTWPQFFAGVYTAKSENVFRKNAVMLPLYQLVVLFVFFVGFAATLAVPGLTGTDADLSLFRIAKMAFAPWAVGMIGAAGLLTALVPGSMLLITAATSLAKNIFRVAVPTSSDRTVGIVARSMVPVLALIALYLALHGGQAIVALLLMGYNVVTQLFPALVLSFGERPRISTAAALSGIIAGELTVAAVTLAGTSLAKLAPGLPQAAKDLNIGVVALLINLAVILLVSVVIPRRERERVA
jgi:SSS family solute:Na+ symporter